MEKFPFTEEGLNELLKTVYALPDDKLALQAAAVIANFRLWLSENFIFVESQTDYLNELSDQFIAFAAISASDFIGRRLPIAFKKADKFAAKTAEAQDKVPTVHKTKKASYAPDGGYEEEESLTFEIMYQ